MIVFDIETIPNPDVIEGREWSAYRSKSDFKGDQDAALYPAFGRIACICAKIYGTQFGFKACGENEADMIREFFSFIQKKNESVFGGHNIKPFDIPFICVRALAHKIPIPQVLNCSGKNPWEVPHVDTMEIMKFGGNTRISLDAMCLVLGVQSPKVLEVNALGVWDAYKAKKFDSIIQYCRADVSATEMCIKNLVELGVIPHV